MTTVEIIQSVLLGGTATTLATQILKSPFIPVPATKHPRITAAVVSVIASAIVVSQAGVDVSNLGDVASVTAIFAGVLLVASTTYNQLIRKG